MIYGCYRFFNKGFTYQTIYDNNGIRIIQNPRGRRIIFRDNLVYKIYENTAKEVKNHTNIQNIINSAPSYDGAKIPKIYYSDNNTIVFEHVGNISYTDWRTKLNSKKNINKVNLKIKSFLNLGGSKILGHGDLHMNNIQLRIDKNNNVKEVYIIDLEFCKLYDNPNLIRKTYTNFRNNLYSIPVLNRLYIK